MRRIWLQSNLSKPCDAALLLRPLWRRGFTGRSCHRRAIRAALGDLPTQVSADVQLTFQLGSTRSMSLRKAPEQHWAVSAVFVASAVSVVFALYSVSAASVASVVPNVSATFAVLVSSAVSALSSVSAVSLVYAATTVSDAPSIFAVSM